MFAVVTSFGRDGQVDYLTVAVQDGGIKHGGNLIASKLFFRENSSSPEALVQGAMDWAMKFGITSVKLTDGLLEPDFDSDGNPTIRVID